jgi:ferredoxin
MNVSIDRGACVSCGACWNICPELFNQNPCDSYSEVIDNYRFNGDRSEGIVPEYLGCCAQEAADLCPVQIIRVC